MGEKWNRIEMKTRPSKPKVQLILHVQVNGNLNPRVLIIPAMTGKAA